MSQFDSLVQSWHDVFGKHLVHRDECLKVAARLRDHLLTVCEWPEEMMAVYRLDVMPHGNPEKKGLVREAMKSDEDGFLVYGLELSVPSRYSHDPKVFHSCIVLRIMFAIGVKKTGDSFTVRITREGNPLPANTDANVAAIVGLILDGLKDEMETSYPAEGEKEIRQEFGFAKGRTN